MVFELIYNEVFIEVFVDSVWIIKLELFFLLVEFELKNSRENVCKKKIIRKFTEKVFNVCRFF